MLVDLKNRRFLRTLCYKPYELKNALSIGKIYSFKIQNVKTSAKCGVVWWVVLADLLVVIGMTVVTGMTVRELF